MKSRFFIPRESASAVAVSLAVMLVAACSANKQQASQPAGSSDTAAAEAPAKGKQQKNPPRPAPAGTPLAKITDGMADTDVRRILGEPDSAKDYVTGKQFIPYYYGPDTARTEWIYKGQGRITLTRNRYTGGLKVIRVDYDPNI